MRNSLYIATLFVVSITLLVGCGGSEPTSVSAPDATATATLPLSELPSTPAAANPTDTVSAEPTVTTEVSPSTEPTVTTSAEATPATQQASLIFFSAPN